MQSIGRDFFRFEQGWWNSGEIWRVISGHWIHAGWAHLALNGLGLAICAHIAEAHGGAIRARHSSLGGVAIDVELPVGAKA